jgi:hypothetical protein
MPAVGRAGQLAEHEIDTVPLRLGITKPCNFDVFFKINTVDPIHLEPEGDSMCCSSCFQRSDNNLSLYGRSNFAVLLEEERQITFFLFRLIG